MLRSKAQSRWDDMEARKEAYDYDNKGPNEDRPLRLPIGVGTDLVARLEHKKQKDWQYHCYCGCRGNSCDFVMVG